MIDVIIESFTFVASYPVILWVFLGLVLGIFFGTIPGIGGGLGMAIMLPFTLLLEAEVGILFLISIYLGAMYGGSIAAILLNAPGTAAAAATTLDGYPMSKNGKAINALTISAVSSAIGGIITVIALFLLSPVITTIVLLFGSPEYFLLALLGLSMITIVSEGSIFKGVTAGLFGLLVTVVGISPITPTLRFTYGSIELYNGLSFLAGLIGMFAISEMLNLVKKPGSISDVDVQSTGGIIEGVKSTASHPGTVIKSSFIGLFTGAIPAAGATIANFVAYTEAMRSSRNPELFGNGSEEGVIASESSNSATVGGSLIPTLAFGIPGSPATAVFLGGLIMHGIIPGPLLFTDERGFTFSVFITLLFGSIFIFVIGTALVTKLRYLTRIDTHVIIPNVIIISILGGFALRGNYIDVMTVVLFGILGYYMRIYDYSVIAFVLGMVLGELAEQNLLRSLQLSDGSFLIFVTRPFSLLIIAMITFILFSPIIAPLLPDMRERLGLE